jgi:cytochrome c peroxidase
MRQITRLLLIGFIALPASSQTLNDAFSAMNQADHLAAFGTLRALEQAGDADARGLIQSIFEAPDPLGMAGQYARPSRQAQRPGTSRPKPVVPAHNPTMAAMPVALNAQDFDPSDPLLVAIGRDLFFDPVLSGNRDIACATCHHPTLATGDGVSLGLGTGARGLGAERHPTGLMGATRLIPRNAPALWNLGARQVRVFFHDGRLEADPQTGKRLTPRGPLPDMQLDSLLAAQTLFPPLSAEEMAGLPGENEIADAMAHDNADGPDGAWMRIAARVNSIDAYHAAFAEWRGTAIAVRMDDIANALGAFIGQAFRAYDTPFDRYLRKEADLPNAARDGLELFFGRANCASCHSGPLLSDQNFHAMGQPHIGPGKDTDDHGYTRDIGRAGVTNDPDDAYAFRTPMLRNVTRTGPWGHSGAFSDLRAFLRHHIDPVAGLDQIEIDPVLPQLAMATDPMDTSYQIELIRSAAALAMAQRPRVALDDHDLDLLMAFLDELTDLTALDALRVPETVPSGLPVD